jgi:hypothetical protein
MVLHQSGIQLESIRNENLITIEARRTFDRLNALSGQCSNAAPLLRAEADKNARQNVDGSGEVDSGHHQNLSHRYTD